MISLSTPSRREVSKVSISPVSLDQYLLADALILSPAQTPWHGTGSLLSPGTG